MKQNKKLKILIIILAILLGISAAVLIGTFLYNHFIRTDPTTVDVPGNIITPSGGDSSVAGNDSVVSESESDAGGGATGKPDTTASFDRSETAASETTVASEAVPETVGSRTTSVSSSKASAISLHNRKPEDNTPFQVTNMFPGDRETKYYCVKVSYKGDIIVRYHADIRPGYEKLAEVLKVKIRLPDTDETLYDGLMRDMPKSLNHALYTNEKTQSELYYEITAYLDTSVGNEYQDKELIADFRWWVEEVDNLDPPPTGDNLNIFLWIALAAGSLFVLIILLAKRRKESADEC